MEFCSLLKGEEPDKSAYDQDDDCVSQEKPVEEDKWLGFVLWLYNRSD